MTNKHDINRVRRWEKENPKLRRKYQYKSKAKNFILKHATHDDLIQVKEWVSERENILDQKEIKG